MSSADQSHTVILHVSGENATIARAIMIANILRAQRPAWQARIIVNGPILEALTVRGEAIGDLEGIKVQACSTGLRNFGIAEQDLQPQIGTVESAVLAIAEAQFAGAAYIRV